MTEPPPRRASFQAGPRPGRLTAALATMIAANYRVQAAYQRLLISGLSPEKETAEDRARLEGDLARAIGRLAACASRAREEVPKAQLAIASEALDILDGSARAPTA
jgi:hypothetical protein